MVMLAVVLIVASVCSGAFASAPGERTLTFDDRVRAQEAIERVDDRHRIGAAQMAALQSYWKISVTDEMLERELRRVAGETKPPERLLEIYSALGNDSFLIKECLARPALVDRLSRDLFAFDPVLHAKARAEAEELRRRLLSGELSPWADHPGRSVFDRSLRATEGVGHVLALEEERYGFVLSLVLSETTSKVRVARYVVSKMTFESWWTTEKKPPQGASIAEVAGERAPSPLPTSDPDRYSSCATAGDPNAFLLGVPGAPLLVGLAVTASVAPEPVVAGDFLTYTIVMQNAGPDTALDAEMLDLLPEDTTYESIYWPATDGSWDCTVPAVGTNGKISCKNTSFAPGTSVTFTITARVVPCQGGTALTSTTIASSATDESDPTDNTATATTTVIDPGTCDDGNGCTDGDRCAPGLSFTENFDLVGTPDIPPGWTSTLIAGPVGGSAWTTNKFRFDTAPNSVFTADAADSRDSVLDSPGIRITSPTAQLRFRNRYNLERDNDGAVLEIKIGDDPLFKDILLAEGSFAEGGYTGTISRNFGSPIAGQSAWTGTSNQFVPTTVNLPVGAAGRTIVLRWRLATDQSVGNVGQWIDSVSITGRNLCQPGAFIACDDNDACTADSCDGAIGCGHVSIPCADGNVCTDDACDPILGCLHTNTTAACDDLDACTGTDVCRSGACVGSNPLECHDADVCTAETCDPAIGCVWPTANIDATAGFSAERVDGRDLTVLAKTWNLCPDDEFYNAEANLDRQDPCIGPADFHLFMNAFGHACAPP